MKRIHIHIGVENIDESVRFYSALFATDPIKLESDYAKWMLDDPKVNFAISTRSGKRGVNHLGIQVDNATELEAMRAQISAADIKTHGDGETVCCYAKSAKSWIEDPGGVAWEAYHTMADAKIFSDQAARTENTCCMPESSERSHCDN